MKPFVFVLTLFSSFQLSAQTRCDCYDRLLNLGNYYANNNQFGKAIEAYKDALSFKDENNDDDEVFTGLVYCYDTLHNYDSSVAYALKAIEKGLGAGYFYSYSPNTFQRLADGPQPEWPRSGQAVNWPLFKLVQQMHGVDQYFRTSENFDKPWLPDSLMQYAEVIGKSIIRAADSNNYVLQMKIFRKFGWPGFEKVGFYPGVNTGMLMHLVRYPGFGRQVLDTLYEFASRCEGILPSKALKLEDNRVLHGGEISMGRGKNLIGFWGVNRFHIIYDIKKADSIRLTHNMLRLKEDVPPEETLPKEYKPIPYPPNYFCLKKYQLK